jgi:hypothetical protein
MNTELFPDYLSSDRARVRLQQTLEEYWFLDNHLRALENTNFAFACSAPRGSPPRIRSTIPSSTSAENWRRVGWMWSRVGDRA